MSRSLTPVSNRIITTPLKIAWATMVGPIRRRRYAAVPSETPTLDRISASPMLPSPRTGSTCATPNKTPWSRIATAAGVFDSRLRITKPRKTSSSTSGAATTAAITMATA